MPYVSKVKDEPEKSKYYLGFQRALNTLQDKTSIDDRSLTQADNVMLVVNGVTRRYGTLKVWDEGSASKVYGACSYYNKTTGARKFLRIANSQLQYLNGSNWTGIGATTYQDIPATLLQIENKVYIHNGTDNLSYYDGSTITTFSDLGSVANLAVVATGSTGSTAYSYRVSAFNTTGETEACARVQISDGNATLSTTNYNKLDWDAVASATGYNIYGRTATGATEVYLTTVYTNTYNDTGAEALVTLKPAPNVDTTAGIKAKHAIYALGRQFCIGVTEGSTYYPTRLFYSGTVQFIDSFQSGEYGGGWADINANDGGELLDIKPYSTGVLVWKTNGIFFFYFTSSGDAAVKDITRSHGGTSKYGSIQVDNNILFVGQKENRIGVWSIGTQENFGSDDIRTNELSVFISPDLANINRLYMSNICTFNYDNKFGFAYTRGANTENDIGFVFDTRFGGFVKWTGLPMAVTQYLSYDDGTNNKLYGCSNSDGYMIEMMYATRSDNGSAFTSTIGTKFWNLGLFDTEKIFRNPSLWFKFISGGTLTAEVWVDGTRYVGTATLSSPRTGSGAGADLAGSFLAGSMYATLIVTPTNADIVKEFTLIQLARNLGIYLVDNNLNTNWLFQGVHLLYSVLSGKPVQSTEKVSLST